MQGSPKQLGLAAAPKTRTAGTQQLLSSLFIPWQWPIVSMFPEQGLTNAISLAATTSLPCCLSKEVRGHSLPEDRLAQHSQRTEPELYRQASHLHGLSYIKEIFCSSVTIIFYLESICTLSLINLSLSSYFSLTIFRKGLIAVLEYFQSYTVHKLLLSLEIAVVLIMLLMGIFSSKHTLGPKAAYFNAACITQGHKLFSVPILC